MAQTDDRPDDALDGVQLSLPSDFLCLLIAKARQMQGKTGSTDPSASELDDDDMELSAMEDRPSDPVEEEVRSLIDDLPEDEQIELVALMWYGRGDGDWAELHALATQEHTPETADYLCGTPLLADYLMEGAAAFGLDCTEFLQGHA
ncbi:MAG: DUF3775 domain-containing protein [Paracoccaceae bacterium]|nr:DUF3775 domain-containing protein [Paracoccaceae bacterium]